MNDTDFAAFIGIDWADERHYWNLAVAATGLREYGTLEHRPQVIELWAAELRHRFPGQLLAVCLEQSRGSLVYQLTRYPHLVLYPVHPAAAAKYREAFFPSGAKGDPGDAALLLEILLHHRDRLRRLDPDTAETRRLMLLAELRRKLVNERTRHSNRLTAWLKLYYPQPLDWIDDIDGPLGCALLLRWPTFQKLRRASDDTLRRFFHNQNCRCEDRIEQRIQAIRSSATASDDLAVLEAGQAATTALVALIQTLQVHIEALDRRLAELTAEHLDAHLFTCLPGAGPALTPRLIAAFGTRRDRFESAAELAAYSGIAPVTKSSGKTQIVSFRHACPRFLRQTFHEFAACSRIRSQWARAFYDAKRKQGMTHHCAVRALAFKWIRVLFRCWKDRTPYDETRYLRHLQQRKSPFVTDHPDPV